MLQVWLKARGYPVSSMSPKGVGSKRGSPACLAKRGASVVNALSSKGHRSVPNLSAGEMAQSMMKHGVPVHKLLRVLGGMEGDQTGRKACAIELQHFSRMQTMYGSVSTCFAMQQLDGTEINIYYNNPFALLHAACTVQPKFATFLLKHLRAGKPPRIVMYADETTPGNVQRPDHGRSYESMLWTFAELPQFFRDRKHGFFKFAHVLSSVVEELEGGMPALLKKMVLTFFDPSGWNFATTGLEIPVPGQPNENVRATFGFFILDERAVKLGLDIKGAAGAKCCGLECLNVCGAQTYPPQGDYFVRYSEPRRSRWHPHTRESFEQVLVELENVKDSPSELAEMELRTGVNYNLHSILWDPYTRRLVGAPHCQFWDGMHCLCASGGIVQYQLNGFVLAILGCNIELTELDNFAAKCAGHKLDGNFFTNRIVHNGNAHIKAFASECVDAVHVLELFVDMVVQPAGVLQDHVACFKLVCKIVKILGKPKDILLNVAELERTLEQHQTLYIQLYKSIPKNHLTRHIVDCILRWETLFTCWAPERDHANSKAIARYAWNNCTRTILDRENWLFFKDLECDTDLLQETHFCETLPVRCDVFDSMLPPGSVATVSDRLCSPIGRVQKNEYVWAVDEVSRRPVLFFVKFFLCVKVPMVPEAYFFTAGLQLAPRGSTWATTVVSPVVLKPVCTLLRRAVVHVESLDPVVVHASL